MTKLHTLFLLICLAGIGTISAQEKDSLTFTNYNWNSKNIKEGLVWKQASFPDLFSSKQEINLIEIDLQLMDGQVKLAGLSDSLAFTSDFAKAVGATAALNGGFFNMKNGGATDYIKVNDTVINVTAKASMRGNAIFAFDGKNFIITDVLDTLPIYQAYPNVLRSGPLLVSDGKPIELNKNAFNDNRHPRTAIALTGNSLLLITVDGRNTNAQGMNLNELANILRWLGSTEAMNLDGGGSTTMYIKGASTNGVVNYPSDNKLFDHEGERKVANVILIL